MATGSAGDSDGEALVVGDCLVGIRHFLLAGFCLLQSISYFFPPIWFTEAFFLNRGKIVNECPYKVTTVQPWFKTKVVV